MARTDMSRRSIRMPTRLESELQLTDSAIINLINYFSPDLSDKQQEKLLVLMRMCYFRGVLVESMEQFRIKKMLEDDRE